MFSNLIVRNSCRCRKENGLFFGSMVISIVAFYMILSLSGQDVISFLKKMEKDAIEKLLFMIPSVYIMTLFVLFFLIFFTYKYQFERRRHEFGVYLMLGMRRSKLFRMLLIEDFLSSILALLVGLPAGILLAEMVSLVTAKLVGIGIVDHQISLSWFAVKWTLVGFLGIKILALIILSGKISTKDIGDLLSDLIPYPQKNYSTVIYVLAFVGGIMMLIAAYAIAIRGEIWQQICLSGLMLFLGVTGTILLFYGMRVLIAFIAKKGNRDKQLHVFIFRQIQENMIRQSNSMAITSLLILATICCFSVAIGIAGKDNAFIDHVIDYTFVDYSIEKHKDFLPAIESELEEYNLVNYFSYLFEMKIANLYISENDDYNDNMSMLKEAVEDLPQSWERDALLNNFKYMGSPYLICLSDYNRLLELSGRPILELNEDEAVVYMDQESTSVKQVEILNKIFENGITVDLAGRPIYITEKIESQDLVADRSITMWFALIVPDDRFYYYANDIYTTYVNGVINEQLLEENSLIHVYSLLNKKFDELGIEYESYLQKIARYLFYTEAATYISLYLGIVFLVVSNTIIGVQFLMLQQKNGNRYRTLIRMGASYEVLCKSARKQITWIMGLPILVAVISSIFGIRALRFFEEVSGVLIVSIIVVVLFCLVEYIYMRVVKCSSDRYLLTLLQPRREE